MQKKKQRTMERLEHVLSFTMNHIRGRGIPKKTIREVIKKDLELNDLDRSMVLDRTLWRKLIHVADPT